MGATVPQSVRLKPLSGKVTSQIPTVKNYDYVMFKNNEILLVNATDRKVADIINAS
jgi:hypothetical protein